jgi:hypothetical protein
MEANLTFTASKHIDLQLGYGRTLLVMDNVVKSDGASPILILK